MKIQTGKKKALLVFSMFSMFSILLICFLVIPVVKKVYQQKDSLEESKITLDRDQKNINEYKNDLDYLKQNTSLNENLMINENNRVELIELLEEIAREEDLELKIEMFGATNTNRSKDKKATINKTFLKLSLSGQYEDLLVFVYKLQNFKYALEIDKLIIEDFDESKIKKSEENLSLEDFPEIEGEIIISFNEQ